MIPLPNKKYQIIYADPAWDGLGYNKNQSGNRCPAKHYSVMSIDDIKGLPVNTIADNNCVLFMWVTFPNLKDAFDVIDAWGFKYATVAFTWMKINENGKPFIGCGNWTRANAEICLLARKGKISRVSSNVPQAILTKRKEHSRKPSCVYERIEKLMGDIPRLELFARQKRQGWDVWGLEAPKEQQNILRNKEDETA